jgi:hypothetical protein
MGERSKSSEYDEGPLAASMPWALYSREDITRIEARNKKNERTEAIHRFQSILISAREDAIAAGLTDDEISTVMLRELNDRHPEIPRSLDNKE